MADGGSKPPQPMSPEQPFPATHVAGTAEGSMMLPRLVAALPSTPHGVEVADGSLTLPQPSLG